MPIIVATALIEPTTIPAISPFVNGFVSGGSMVVVAEGGEVVLSELGDTSVVVVGLRAVFVDILEVDENMVWLDGKIDCAVLITTVATGVL